jgi:2-phospho-L-lactate guanylyltransferase
VQATVYRFDPQTGSGSVLTDSGDVLPFTASALEHSGLRHLRPGQRLTAVRDGDQIIGLTLGTIGAHEE